MTLIDIKTLSELCETALTSAGAPPAAAKALAEATAQAERRGKTAVGIAHLFDYLDGYLVGRITREEPTLSRPAPAMFTVDARGGLAQYAFELFRDDFAAAVRELGAATLWVSGSFTCGELGYYPRELAYAGLVSIACANSPALMSVGGSSGSVLGTNPLAYAVPRPGAEPLVIDQASSSTAFVKIRQAAETGESIPAGWAVDESGQPTTDAAAALGGALLPFGGHRGGNIALLVEILATLAGANFSADAPPFDHGSESPGTGMFVIAVDQSKLPPSATRLSSRLANLDADQGMRIPAFRRTVTPAEVVSVSDELLHLLRSNDFSPIG